MSSGQILALKNASLYDANFERQVSLFKTYRISTTDSVSDSRAGVVTSDSASPVSFDCHQALSASTRHELSAEPHPGLKYWR